MNSLIPHAPKRPVMPMVKFTLSTLRLFCFFPLLVWAVWAQSAITQVFSHDEITASYLYNFSKNVTWPNEGSLDAITVGVYRPTNTQLTGQLRAHFRSAILRGLPLKVRDIHSINSLNGIQILLIEEENNPLVEELNDELSSRPILLVTNNYRNRQLVMINLISTDDNHIRFEVNKANMIVQGLDVKPEIILNGGSEIDVAQLFREGQASLVKIQQKLRIREEKLSNMEKGVRALKTENDTLNTTLTKIQSDIQKSQQLILTQRSLINEHKATLHQTDIARQALESEVIEQTRQLNSRQFLLDDISAKIANRETQLHELNDTLIKQKSRIIELDDRIATQGVVLNNLIALVLLGVVLVAVTIWAYTNKRRDAERLEAHSHDLQIARDKLAIAKAKAEEANRAKSEFLSLMSHELRTPLQAIIGYADVVIEELRMEGLEQYTSDLNRVISNSERLLRLINGVLDLAKIEAGRMTLSLSQVNLESITSDAIANVRPQCDEKQLALAVVTDNGDNFPVADEEKLLHIILNLLSNACKFTNTGVVKIVSEHRKNQIYISVQDTGSGIKPEQIPHVFERFQQADSSETRQHQGSGLGLAISKQFCELMGGKISVSSELNMGSTFTVSIPLPIQHSTGEPDLHEPAPTGKKEIAVKLDKPASNAGGITILLVDDDKEFINIMTRTLKSENYTVLSSETGGEGLIIAKKIIPDVIVLDLLLPDMNGMEFLRTIRKMPSLSHTPIFVASVIDEKNRCLELGATGFLAKPVTREAIKSAIRSVVSNAVAC